MLYQTQLFRQAITMGEDEEPLDSDPYCLWSDPSQRQRDNVMPYEPQVLETLQTLWDR